MVATRLAVVTYVATIASNAAARHEEPSEARDRPPSFPVGSTRGVVGNDTTFPFAITNYGAVGDGVHDDAPAVQAAIDACVAAGGGCTVYIPPATRGYNISRTLWVRSDAPLHVVGDGWASLLLWSFDGDLLVWAPPGGGQAAHLRLASFAVACVGATGKSRASTAVRFSTGVVRSTIDGLLFFGRGAVPGTGVSGTTCGTNLDLGGTSITDTVTVRDTLHWFVGGTGVVVGRGSEVRILGGRIVGPGVRDDGSIGVHVTGNNGGVHVAETDVIGLAIGVLLNNASGAGSNREVFITHATIDSDGVGLWVNDSSYVSVAGCWAASSDTANVLLGAGAAGAHVVIAGGEWCSAAAGAERHGYH